MAIPVIAIFDIGKTNKKLFLFNEDYEIVFERSARFIETMDEDGFACENLESLCQSVYDSINEILRMPQFEIKAVNFSTYGASLVYVDDKGKPLTPLYNYLKPFPPELSRSIYDRFGGEGNFAAQTSSPLLGSLNSGLQLLRLKKEKPELFESIKYALHLPQYVSYLLSGQFYSDITSIGCHTTLWDFGRNAYHQWVEYEGLVSKFAPILKSNETLNGKFPLLNCKVGIGLHDSSAALVPYLVSFSESFILISTGTWCVNLNPFNDSPLTASELENDCLCYLDYQGIPVKSSRLFSGNEHEEQVKRIADYFHEDIFMFRTAAYDVQIIDSLQRSESSKKISNNDKLQKQSVFQSRDLNIFSNAISAYHQLMIDLVQQQASSIEMILGDMGPRRIFVDGGFSKNNIYMNLLSAAFPDIEIYSASMAQATALGAALAIHDSWNIKPIPGNIIELKYYAQHKSVSR